MSTAGASEADNYRTIVKGSRSASIVRVERRDQQVVQAEPSRVFVESAPAGQQLVTTESQHHLIRAEQRESRIVLAGVRGSAGTPGAPGPSAFDDWLIRTPGGSWEQFLAAISGGGGLISQKILRFYDAVGALHYFALNERLELPIQLTDGSMSSVVTIGVLHGRA